MRRVEQPVAAPGQCFICASTAHPPFVDLEFNTEFEDNFPFEYGAVYVCQSCIVLMAQTLDLASKLSNQELEAELLKAQTENFDLSIKVDRMGKAIEHLVSAGYTGNSRVELVPDFVPSPLDDAAGKGTARASTEAKH